MDMLNTHLQKVETDMRDAGCFLETEIDFALTMFKAGYVGGQCDMKSFDRIARAFANQK